MSMGPIEIFRTSRRRSDEQSIPSTKATMKVMMTCAAFSIMVLQILRQQSQSDSRKKDWITRLPNGSTWYASIPGEPPVVCFRRGRP